MSIFKTKEPQRVVTLPTSIIVHRDEPQRDRVYTSQWSERIPVIVQPETAPKPIDDTSFYGVGRDPTHAWPHIWRYQALRVKDWLSFRSWEGAGDPLVVKIPSAKVVGMPMGRHLAATERTNIVSPESTSYGALATLNPAQAWSPVYRKITG